MISNIEYLINGDDIAIVKKLNKTKMEETMTPLQRVRNNQNRSDFMAYIYDLYDRSNAPIPKRNTYTGLAELYAKHVGMKEIERQVELWHDEKTQEQIKAFNRSHPVTLESDET